MTALRLHALLPILLTIGALAWLAHAAVQDARVRIIVEGARTQFEPAYVRLRIHVQPDPANRGLTVALISEGFARSSYEQLDGDRSPRTRWIDYRDVPAGEYDALAIVARGDGSAPQDRATLSVLGR